MKKYTHILFKSVVAMLLMITGISCQKLIEAPKGQLTPATFYLTPAQCEASLAGSMNCLYTTWGGYCSIPAWPDGQLDGASLALDGTNFQYWQWHYKAIAQINPVIGSIKAGNLKSYPAADMADLEGQARFLRAFNYFTLVRLYGKIPFIDENTPNTASTPLKPSSRLSVDSIYDKIEADLVFAVANMYDYNASTPARPSKYVAEGLLAKVYLTRATAPLMETDNYAKARDAADDVIKNSSYSLSTNLTTLFSTSNTNNSEDMFCFQSDNDYPALPGLDHGPDEWGSWDDGAVKVLWAQAYPEQPRKRLYILLDWPVDPTNPGDFSTWINYSNSNIGTPWAEKYTWPNLTPAQQLDGSGPSGIVMPILRLADVYLMYAEAANMAGTGPTQLAVDRLNTIINRANAPVASVFPQTSTAGTEAVATTSMSQAAFNQKVWDERNYELCFEFDRYFDVLREKVLQEVNLPDNANDYDPKDYLFPIPPLDATFIGQNPGY